MLILDAASGDSGMFTVAVIGGATTIAVNIFTLVKVYVVDKERLVKLEVNHRNTNDNLEKLETEVKELKKEITEAHNGLVKKMEENFDKLGGKMQELSDNLIRLNSTMAKSRATSTRKTK